MTILTKRQMSFLFKLGTCITVFALIAVTAGILFTESWRDVVDDQLEALRQKNISKAYLKYTSSQFQEKNSEEQFRQFIESHPAFFNNQSAHFSQRSVDQHIRSLKGILTAVDHSQAKIEYKLIKENGKWKILSINFIKRELQKSKKKEID